MRGLVFETSGPLAALAAAVGSACRRLTEANVPHNLFIVDRGARVFLLPNAFAERKVPACPRHPARPGAHCSITATVASLFSRTPPQKLVNDQNFLLCRDGSTVQFTGRRLSGRSQPCKKDAVPWMVLVPLSG